MPLLLAESPLTFERPGWLLLVLLMVPVILLSRRGRAGAGPAAASGRIWTAVAFRCAVILLLAVALAQPSLVKQGRGLTLLMVVDVSQSVPLGLKREVEQTIREIAASKRRPEDRIGVVVIGRDADIVVQPASDVAVSAPASGVDTTATDLALGVRKALSILPQDTANRIILVSDGNETTGNVLAEAALAAASGVPIDVLPIQYEHRNEVIFEGIRAPTRARLGQSADLRLTIRAMGEVEGTLSLWRNDQPVDLDPDSASGGLRLRLQPGPNVVSVPLSFDEPGTQRFRAVFEPDRDGPDGAVVDTIEENNTGVAVTFVGGEGRVLLVSQSELEASSLLAALRGSGVDTHLITPEEFTGGLAYLNGFDAVGLVGVPRWAFNFEADGALHAYVHDLGGGLVMLGGPLSFGAGGWIDTEVAKALPVDMDPPQTRQMPRGALAMVIHSCEMPQGNYWSTVIAKSAIDALSRLDYVGIVTFNWGAAGGGFGGNTWAFPMQIAGDKVAAKAAVDQMVVGDMPDFAPAMQLTLQGLLGVNVGQRHCIVISDGDPIKAPDTLMRQYVDAGITVTTVMVAGHGTADDLVKMNSMAGVTGGRFYNVTNPRALPQIFVKEAQMVARSLIVEGDFPPTLGSRLPGPVARFTALPPIGGFVLTAPRGGLAQMPLFVRSSEADDPLYAFQNYGLGRTIAWTSDATGRWAPAWVRWSGFADFWEETFRWLMRPATPNNVVLNTTIDGDMARVELRATDEDGRFLNFLQTQARVIKPDNSSEPLRLRQRGPGDYEATFPVAEAGAYLVNVVFEGSSQGRQLTGSVQGAVAVPYPREFRAVRDNAALLKAVAERTGGKVRAGRDSAVVDYFEQEALPMPRSAKRIWDLLAIIAAVLFLFDVAIRRIAIEPEAVAATLRRLARAKEASGEETMAAWKKARSQAGRRTTGPAGAGGQAQPGQPPLPPDRAVAQRRFEADEGAGPGLDVAADASGRGAEGRGGQRPGAAAPPPASGRPSGAAPDGPHTSRLLDAKRRAQSGTAPSGSGESQPPPAAPGSEGDPSAGDGDRRG